MTTTALVSELVYNEARNIVVLAKYLKGKPSRTLALLDDQHRNRHCANYLVAVVAQATAVVMASRNQTICRWWGIV